MLARKVMCLFHLYLAAHADSYLVGTVHGLKLICMIGMVKRDGYVHIGIEGSGSCIGFWI